MSTSGEGRSAGQIPGQRRPRGAAPIQDLLKDFLKESGLTKRPLSGRVFDAWRQAAGSAICKHAVAVRFRGTELLVEVDSAAHFHELSNFTGEDLRVRANEILGVDRIRKIAFKRKS